MYLTPSSARSLHLVFIISQLRRAPHLSYLKDIRRDSGFLDTLSQPPLIARSFYSYRSYPHRRASSPQDVQLAEKEQARYRRARAPGHIASQDPKTHTRCSRRSHVDSSRRARVLRHPRGPQTRQQWPTEHRHKCHEGQGQRKG